MGNYIRRRLLSVIPVMLGVTIVVFGMLRLVPGDPVVLMYSRSMAAPSAEAVEAKRQELGLNDPLYVQYGRFLWNALHGDLGRSIQTNRPVAQEILQQLPSTLELTAAGMLIAVAVGLILGIIAGWKRNSWIDSLCMVTALTGVSIPSFWLAFLLILFFSLTLGWLPATGFGGWKRLVMPAATLGFTEASVIARLVRSSMIEVLQEDYITAARAKGLRERAVLTRHALKNTLIPVVTFVGLQFGYLLGGAVVVEAVFARQGIGRLAVDAIIYKDIPLVQGCILWMAAGFVLVNLLVDLLYGYLDPRIRYQ